MYTVDRDIGCGSRSGFMTLKNRQRCGFKTFLDFYSADYAYRLQRSLSYKNLAPKVLSQVGRVRFRNGSLSSWGYVSETARLMPRCFVCCDEVCYASDHIRGCNNTRQIKRVLDKLIRLDIYYEDSHSHNFGYIRRNRKYILVPIDFGKESVVISESY